MAHPISALGAIHTIISLVPFVAGITAFTRHGTIDSATGPGRIYLAGLVLSVLTSFGLSSTGGFNPGHALGILALLAAFGGVLIPRLGFLGRLGPYLSVFGISFSFFLLLVPAINETLTRLPAAQPLATGQDSPLVKGTLLAWLVIFLVGATLQVRLIRSRSTR